MKSYSSDIKEMGGDIPSVGEVCTKIGWHKGQDLGTYIGTIGEMRTD